MALIDEKKEYISILKLYISLIMALVLTIGAGVINLFLSNTINILFWMRIVTIITLIVVFVVIVKKIHNNISRLKKL
ncbi:MAG: hypothetical protein DRQ51_10185 [Gammaproteobacteria bacterium]|nr:MAG: hypothetical protein DRQ51_10185 [Gammaproteobacteria bacterium]